MKSITIAGRVGKDAELRRTQSGDAVASFSVAVDDGWGDRKTTLWFDCSIFGKRAEKAPDLIRKGTALTLVGDFGKREHDGKTYLTVRVSDFTLQGNSRVDQTKSEPTQTRAYDNLGGDEIPF